MFEVSKTDFGAWVTNILAIICIYYSESVFGVPFYKVNLQVHASFVLHAI